LRTDLHTSEASGAMRRTGSTLAFALFKKLDRVRGRPHRSSTCCTMSARSGGLSQPLGTAASAHCHSHGPRHTTRSSIWAGRGAFQRPATKLESALDARHQHSHTEISWRAKQSYPAPIRGYKHRHCYCTIQASDLYTVTGVNKRRFEIKSASYPSMRIRSAGVASGARRLDRAENDGAVGSQPIRG